MKKLALCAIALNILSINTVLAKKVEAPVSPIKDTALWSGFFAGVNAGYAYNSQNANTSASNVQYCTVAEGCLAGSETALASINGATQSYNMNNPGFIGGGQAGFNKAITNKYVLGLITDLQGITNTRNTNYKSSTVDSSVGGLSQNIITNSQTAAQINYLGTLRGNLGLLVTPNVLISGTGGLAYGQVKSNIIINQRYGIPENNTGVVESWNTTANNSDTRVGWTAGGTIDWVLNDNWSASLGYLYYDLGTTNYNSGNLIAAITVPNDPQNFFNNATNTKVHFTGNVVRFGLNYHFT